MPESNKDREHHDASLCRCEDFDGSPGLPPTPAEVARLRQLEKVGANLYECLCGEDGRMQEIIEPSWVRHFYSAWNAAQKETPCPQT